MHKYVLTILIVLAASGCRHEVPSYFQAREVNGIGYRVYVPPARDPNKKLPVMLYLHGSNRRGTDNEAQLEDLADVIRHQPENFPYMIVLPQCRPDTYWTGPMTEYAIAALDQTIKEFNGDADRLYLAGFSMGGFGTWQAAITYPNKFAAIVPVAGGIEPTGKVSDEDRALLSPQVNAAASSPDPYGAFAEALKATPVWVVHGSKDEAVPVEGARKIVAALKEAGNTNVNYFELEGVGHGSVGHAFSDPKLSGWLAKQQLGNNGH